MKEQICKTVLSTAEHIYLVKQKAYKYYPIFTINLTLFDILIVF